MKFATRICTLILASYGNLAAAGIIINIDEVGADVMQSFSGSINVDALIDPGVFASYGSGIVPNYPAIAFGGAGTLYDFNLLTSDGIWGPGAGQGAEFDNVEHDFVFYADPSDRRILLPLAYVSGTQISGAKEFLNTDLLSLGLVSGVYNYTFGNIGGVQDFVTVNVGASSVPSPATLGLFGIGLVAMGLRRRKSA